MNVNNYKPPFEILTFTGNSYDDLIKTMQKELEKALYKFNKEGRPMKPLGAPVLIQGQSGMDYKMMLMLWEDHGAIVMAMMGGLDNLKKQNECNHSCGYKSDQTPEGSVLRCRKCGLVI